MIGVISFARPQTIPEAIGLMANGDYRPIAGGTDLIPQLRFSSPAKILDVAALNLNQLKEYDDYIEIGSGCTHAMIASSELIRKYLPILGMASGMVGSQQIRNRGTIGGNIVNASPCADTAPALLMYDTEVILRSQSGERRIKLAEFMVHPYNTKRNPDELLAAFICKKGNIAAGNSYLKLGRRQAVNISRMTVTAAISQNESGIISKAKIACGSVFPTPSRVKELEDMLSGQKASTKLFNEAGNLAAELMIKASGYRWSTPYKQPVLTGLIKRALGEATRGKSN